MLFCIGPIVKNAIFDHLARCSKSKTGGSPPLTIWDRGAYLKFFGKNFTCSLLIYCLVIDPTFWGIFLENCQFLGSNPRKCPFFEGLGHFLGGVILGEVPNFLTPNFWTFWGVATCLLHIHRHVWHVSQKHWRVSSATSCDVSHTSLGVENNFTSGNFYSCFVVGHRKVCALTVVLKTLWFV